VYSALELYASVVVLIAASAALGQAVMCACGRRTWSWLAPAIGLATLVTLAGATVRLPGRELTATAVVGVAVAASIALLWARRPRAPAELRVGLLVVVVIVAAASVPFAAAGGFGAFQGKSNDLGYYLYDAQWLDTHDGFKPSHIYNGFPMGVPAIALVTAKATGGASLVATFTAFMVAAVVATGLAALTVFGRLGGGLRTLAALLVALPYMGASFYVGSSFKEVAMGTFALTFAISLRELVGEDRREQASGPGPPAAIVPLGLLLVASVYTYSFAGAYWPLGTLGLWTLAAAFVARRRLRAVLGALRPRMPRTGLGRVVAAVGLAAILAVVFSQVDQVIDFAQARGSLGALSGGDVAGGLPGTPWFYTALGVWPVTDYRAPVPNMVIERLLFLFALAAAARGVFLLWRRGELALLGGVATAGILYLAARFGSGPYVQSKAIAIMAPAAMLVAVYGALTAFAPSRLEGVSSAQSAAARAKGAAERLLASRAVWGPVAIVFLGGALLSTYLALAGALINGGEQSRQLEELGRRVQGSRVLFLGSDDYVGWELRGASVFSSDPRSGVAYVPPKVGRYWTRYDFDSMTPAQLDLADFVITARSPLMSQPPPNFERVATTEFFELWRRDGPTPPRRTLLEEVLPGEELRCDTAQGRRLSKSAGVAHVISPTPVYGRKGDWLASGERPAAKGFRRPTALVPGRALTQELKLGKGRWAISLQYHSADPVRVQSPGHTDNPLLVRGPGLDALLPPNSQRLGSFWPAGSVALRRPGRLPITVETRPRSGLRDLLAGPDRLDTGTAGLIVGIAATRVGAGRETVPLRRACGRFVDWYRES
jgi:hypothetical protein